MATPNYHVAKVDSFLFVYKERVEEKVCTVSWSLGIWFWWRVKRRRNGRLEKPKTNFCSTFCPWAASVYPPFSVDEKKRCLVVLLFRAGHMSRAQPSCAQEWGPLLMVPEAHRHTGADTARWETHGTSQLPSTQQWPICFRNNAKIDQSINRSAERGPGTGRWATNWGVWLTPTQDLRSN